MLTYELEMERRANQDSDMRDVEDDTPEDWGADDEADAKYEDYIWRNDKEEIS